MYPNPQDVLPLPPHPDIHQYRRRAKELVRACRSADEGAIREWSARWIGDLDALRDDGAGMTPREIDRLIGQVSEFAGARLKQRDCALTQAQFVIARAHGFESWTKPAHHLGALGSPSAVSTFEQAADAIIGGNVATLARLLREHPGLVHTRSTREHRATLLHYVAANGVENYRQITPPNIVDIATMLLDAGAEVDAEADVYGGGATTLLLTATSAHPRRAGVQIELMDLLLARGARVSERAVRDCLMNGCPEAAAHFARLGAPVGIEEAAGIGAVAISRAHSKRRRPLHAPTTAASPPRSRWPHGTTAAKSSSSCSITTCRWKSDRMPMAAPRCTSPPTRVTSSSSTCSFGEARR